VEVSPVLLFSPEEYKNHARHTILDSYTFTWPARDGSMALALGIGKFSDSNPHHLQLSSGSLFNHSVDPNTSFSIDKDNLAIRFTTSRAIRPEEELCIFYSHNLWFEDQSPKGFINRKGRTQTSCSKEEDPFLQLSTIEPDDDLEEILDEESLPFEKLRYLNTEEETEVDATSASLHLQLNG
jgi:tRNA-specific adenosine deaminase 3